MINDIILRLTSGAQNGSAHVYTLGREARRGKVAAGKVCQPQLSLAAGGNILTNGVTNGLNAARSDLQGGRVPNAYFGGGVCCYQGPCWGGDPTTAPDLVAITCFRALD